MAENGNKERRYTDPTNFVTVDEVPPITRTGRSGSRKSKWDPVVLHLRENPGVKIKYDDVSSSLGNDLQKRFHLKAENRDVRDNGNRATLYLQYDPDFEAELIAREQEEAEAEANA